REQRRNSYKRTLIRPRALQESLSKVSEEAVNALIQEEFKELQELADHLRQIGYTPLEVEKLQGYEDRLELAREVGLLTPYDYAQGSDTEVKRYKVPDLYRLGLNMQRKGQA
ncbi:MAG: ParA family protein, partial [Spirulinaceae cyanobacterium]